MGRQVLLTYCCSTAPIAVSEASVMRHVGASSLGYERREALARASLVSLKAVKALSFQVSVWDFGFRRAWRGCIRSAQ